MQAVFCRTYGSSDVVTVEEVPAPSPGPDEVQIRVHAATISSGDVRVRTQRVPKGFGFPMRLVFGWSKPRQPVLGTDLAGVIEAVGERVTRFRVGEAVFANTGMRMGAHAEFCVLKETAAIAPIPVGLSFADATAIVFGGSTALTFLRDLAGVKPGEHVLVIGASGAVGNAAVQISKALDATVTGVASAAKHNLVLSLGADHFIDYANAPVPGNAPIYDVIVDTVGHLSFRDAKPALRENGRLCAIVAGVPDFLQMPFARLSGSRRLLAGVANESADDLRFLGDLATSGRLRPLMGAEFPISEARAAHRAAENAHKTGSIVLRMV